MFAHGCCATPWWFFCSCTSGRDTLFLHRSRRCNFLLLTPHRCASQAFSITLSIAQVNAPTYMSLDFACTYQTRIAVTTRSSAVEASEGLSQYRYGTLMSRTRGQQWRTQSNVCTPVLRSKMIRSTSWYCDGRKCTTTPGTPPITNSTNKT